MGNITYVDGDFVDAAEASIPVSDVGLLRGYGIFDFTRTFKGEPFHLREHIERLFETAAQIELAMPWTPDEIEAIVRETLARNTFDEAFVRMIVTGGDAPDTLVPTGDSRLIVTVQAAPPINLTPYIDGARVLTATLPRFLPGVKTLSYISAVKARRHAAEVGAVEVIYVGDAGRIYEGTTSNLFIFQGDTLVTPPLEGVLRGVTRQAVMDLAAEVFPVEERAFDVDALYDADEVFLTSSTKMVMPIVRVDDRMIGDGRPGSNTHTLMRRFGQMTGVPFTAPVTK